jgi:hypothetical protein
MAVPNIPSNRVLPTLNNDGSRRWVRPKAFHGKYYWRRLLVGWGLIAMFVTLPFIQIGGAPAILLDIPGRKFHLFGATFLATDGVLLMLLMLTIFVSIFWLTALLGRVWCGWGCPQTVYLEFLFRPIEQWLEGSRGQQLKLDREVRDFRRVIGTRRECIPSLLRWGRDAWSLDAAIATPAPNRVLGRRCGLGAGVFRLCVLSRADVHHHVPLRSFAIGTSRQTILDHRLRQTARRTPCSRAERRR